jgi:hypothetical protein
MRRLPAALVVAALPLVAATPAAAQQSAAVADGQTMLRLDRGTAKVLQDAGVRVSPVGPASVGASGLTFPVTGGAADPRTLAGTVRHSGGIRFRAGDRSVVLRSPTYRIGRRSSLSLRVGGDRLRVLALDTSDARVRRSGLDTRASRIRATLTGAAARALNRAFGVHLFAAGLPIGTVRTEVAYSEVVFAGRDTTLALDPGAASALQSLGIAAAPLSPASAGDTGLAFPITGGKVDAASLAGRIRHSGGIALTRDATRVELSDFTIVIDDTPALTARVGGARVEILALDVSGIQRSGSGRNVVVSGVVARLTAVAAQALNQAFGTSAFTEGLVLGTATVNGRAR